MAYAGLVSNLTALYAENVFAVKIRPIGEGGQAKQKNKSLVSLSCIIDILEVMSLKVIANILLLITSQAYSKHGQYVHELSIWYHHVLDVPHFLSAQAKYP